MANGQIIFRPVKSRYFLEKIIVRVWMKSRQTDIHTDRFLLFKF